MFTRTKYGISVEAAMSLGKAFDFSDHKKNDGGGYGIYSIEVIKAILILICIQ
jgi:hypothetical protein